MVNTFVTFTYKLTYKAGKSNCVADALTRLPLNIKDNMHCPVEYVHMVESLETFDLSFENIKNLTKNDAILSKLLGYLKFGWPKQDKWCTEYANVKTDLSIHDDVVLFRNRVVVPSVIRSRVLNMLHVGHNGIVWIRPVQLFGAG